MSSATRTARTRRKTSETHGPSLFLQEKGCQKPLIVTSDYHLPRALAIARDAGLEAQGAGSPCRPEWNYWLKNHMREALAWVKYWGVKYLGLKL